MNSTERMLKLAGIEKSVIMEQEKQPITVTLGNMRLCDQINARVLAAEYGGQVTVCENGSRYDVTVEFKVTEDYEDTAENFMEAHILLSEKKMTKEQVKKREEIVKAMKEDSEKLKEEHGDDWKKVMYATATKQAMGESVEEAPECEEECVLEEGMSIPLGTILEKTRKDFMEFGKKYGKPVVSTVDGKMHAAIELDKSAGVSPPEQSKKAQEIKTAWSELKKSLDEKTPEHKQANSPVKEAASDDNNNFIQSDDEAPTNLNARMGINIEREHKIAVPKDIIAAIDKRISELKKSIEEYDTKGYNDDSMKHKAVTCLEQIKENLAAGDKEALKQAMIYNSTLMSPIKDLFPAQLEAFLAKGYFQEEPLNKFQHKEVKLDTE